MKILLTASSSFAATGLAEPLAAAGHEVWTFNRSKIANAGARDLCGSYDKLADIALTTLQNCDVLINYAIVKNGSIEENIAFTDLVLEAARRLGVKRFIHISSISVLPAITGTVNEQTQAVQAKWKGIYSRVKAAVETHVIERWTTGELVIVRPGFILAQGLVDSMVGIGMKLPTGQVLGLGNRKSIIPLIHRAAVNQAVVAMCQSPLSASSGLTVYMLVAPNAPTREEYLGFQCLELGRGWKLFSFPAWMWRVGLACGSVPLTLIKRRQIRLVKLFEHNLNVRRYDCSQTQKALGLDLTFDWKRTLCDLTHVRPSPAWPGGLHNTATTPTEATGTVDSLAYFGMGRIVRQKHLPGMARNGFTGRISWSDPILSSAPSQKGLKINSRAGIAPDTTHVVITAPWIARAKIFDSLPPSVTHVLVEKPFAVTRTQLDEFKSALASKNVRVLHNYRYKTNVLAFQKFLRDHPSGALRQVALHFETPSPALEQSSWMKQERRHRILLTDYAMHYLDLAWLFLEGDMKMHRCDTKFNDRDELETLSASLSFNGTPCDILIRQGGHQRQCILNYHFQNYSMQLRFFPDVFIPIIGGQGWIDDVRLAARGLWSTGQKVFEKLGIGSPEGSHDLVLAGFTTVTEPSKINDLSIESLTPFYERLTTLADHVYSR